MQESQKHGVLKVEDFGKSLRYQNSYSSIFQTQQRARTSHLLANRDSAEIADGSEQQASCEQRRRLPYFADRKDIGGEELKTAAQISRSRGQEYPPPALVEKASIAQKAQTRTAVHTCNTADTPQKLKSCNWRTCTDQSRQKGREVESPVQQSEVSKLVRGRLTGRHPHGLPMGRRSAEKAQNAWFSSGM